PGLVGRGVGIWDSVGLAELPRGPAVEVELIAAVRP
ncbi:RidA family protein, partial [Pseudomonas aeruginosa]|nr:RidA family protein [Pseudomonas aeruginosa]